MRPGFTLAELVVTLGVLGIMATAAAPAVGVWLGQEPTTEEALGALLRSARGQALEEAAPVTLTIHPLTGGWLVESAAGGQREGRLDLDGLELVSDRRRLVIRFAATGGADAGTVTVKAEGSIGIVRADRWTGAVSIDAP